MLSLSACGSNSQETTASTPASAADGAEQTTSPSENTAAETPAPETTVASEAAPEAGSASGTIVITGSTSVEKILNDMKDEFEAQNPDVSIEYTGSGSSAGIADTKAGTNNIGAASRELKEDEVEEALKTEVFAYDGIAVIVNPANEAVADISAEQLADIYPGKLQTGARWVETMRTSLWYPARRVQAPEAPLRN